MAIPKRRLKPSEDEIRAIAEGTMGLDDDTQVGGEAVTETQPVVAAPAAVVPEKMPSTAQPTEIQASKTGRAGNLRGNKEITTIGFNPRFLDHIDQAASMLNINRTAFINLAATSLVRATYRDYLDRLDRKPDANS